LRPHDASPIDISESDVRVLAGDAFDPATVWIERGLVASLVTITTTGLEWEATWLKEREHRPHVHLPWTDVADISVRKTAGLLSPALFELSLQTGQTVSFVGRHYRDAENAVAAIKPTLASHRRYELRYRGYLEPGKRAVSLCCAIPRVSS